MDGEYDSSAASTATTAALSGPPVDEPASPMNGNAFAAPAALDWKPAGPGYVAAVPTFSPYTPDAAAAVRLAWRVIAAAFITLLVLAIGLPLARNLYVDSAIEPRPALVTAIDGGVIFVQRRGANEWVAARPEEQVVPGDTLRTAANARAFVRLFDQSTVLLYPSSTLRVLRAEQGRFRDERRVVVLELTGGRARLGVAPPPNPSTAFFQVRTPNGQIHLAEGSYSVDFAKGTTQASARLGQATAYASLGSAQARAGQRLTMPEGRAPLGSQPARRDLLENGFLSERDGTNLAGWVVRDKSEQDPSGSVSLATVPGAATFQRTGRGHGETFISQTLDTDLWDFERIMLPPTCAYWTTACPVAAGRVPSTR